MGQLMSKRANDEKTNNKLIDAEAQDANKNNSFDMNVALL